MIETIKPVIENYHGMDWNYFKRRYVKRLFKIAYCGVCGNVILKKENKHYCKFCGNNIDWGKYKDTWGARFVDSTKGFIKVSKRGIE